MKSGIAEGSPGELGLTMIEILIVVAILAVLISLGAPSYRLMKANARSTVCSSNLRNIGIGRQRGMCVA